MMHSHVTGFTGRLEWADGGDDEVRRPVRAATNSLRLLAVDPHELVTWGLRTVLTQQPWVERCLQATDLTQASALAAGARLVA